MNAQANAQLDHLVVLADSLDAGVQWCEQTLGITPNAGGEHPLMGTHNRLINVSSPAYPRAYLEIIALHPGVQPTRDASMRRWFDMDDEALRAQQMAWLRGLLTGHNYAHPKEQVSVVSTGTIENFITRFCKDNPQGNYTDGGLRMSDLYSGRNRPIAR